MNEQILIKAVVKDAFFFRLKNILLLFLMIIPWGIVSGLSIYALGQEHILSILALLINIGMIVAFLVIVGLDYHHFRDAKIFLRHVFLSNRLKKLYQGPSSVYCDKLFKRLYSLISENHQKLPYYTRVMLEYADKNDPFITWIAPRLAKIELKLESTFSRSDRLKIIRAAL